MIDYEKYETEYKKIKENNTKLLNGFKKWLKKDGVTDETIEEHIFNVDLYINEFLLYEDAVEAEDGTLDIGMYLGYWFIKKTMWASSTQIKKNVASLKKFYNFLHKENFITTEELKAFLKKIKEDAPSWIASGEK